MLDSHHSLHDGSANPENVEHDTKSPRVLVSTNFTYWGGSGPAVPAPFRDFDGEDVVCSNRGHRSQFAPDLVAAFTSGSVHDADTSESRWSGCEAEASGAAPPEHRHDSP